MHNDDVGKEARVLVYKFIIWIGVVLLVRVLLGF